MIKQQAQQEGKACYMVRFRGDATTFIWSSTPENPLKSSVDLKVRVQPSDLLWLAENLGCPIEDGKILTSHLDLYNRMLVYACVRSTVKSIETARNLAMLILELNSWDALYWASRFRELWWEHRKYRYILKAVRAFKLFFGLS